MLSLLVTALLAVSSFAAPNDTNIKRDLREPVVPSGWTAVGCYADSTAVRTLNAAGTTSTDLMTLAVCTSFCTYKRGVFAYAGVEYGQECYCGNVMNVAGSPASGCDTPCSLDSSQKCGGPDRIFIARRDISGIES